MKCWTHGGARGKVTQVSRTRTLEATRVTDIQIVLIRTELSVLHNHCSYAQRVTHACTSPTASVTHVHQTYSVLSVHCTYNTVCVANTSSVLTVRVWSI